MRSRGVAAPSTSQLVVPACQPYVQRIYRHAAHVQGTGQSGTIVDAAVSLARRVLGSAGRLEGAPPLTTGSLLDLVSRAHVHSHTSHADRELIAATVVLLPLLVSQQLVLSEVQEHLGQSLLTRTLADASALMQAALDPETAARSLSHSCEAAGWSPLAVASAMTWSSLATNQPGFSSRDAHNQILHALAQLSQNPRPTRRKIHSQHSAASSVSSKTSHHHTHQEAACSSLLQAGLQTATGPAGWGAPHRLPRVMCMSVSPQPQGVEAGTLEASEIDAQASRSPSPSPHSLSQLASPPDQQQGSRSPPPGSMYVMEGDDSDSPGIPVLAARAPLRQPPDRLQRPASRPRPVPSPPPLSQVPSEEAGASLQQPLSESAAQDAGSMDSSSMLSTLGSTSESDDEGSWGDATTQQSSTFLPKELRVARAVPMHLVPLTPTSCLLDPSTQQPLSPPNPSSTPHQPSLSPDQGVPLPVLGPWVVTSHPAAFPASDAVVQQPASQRTRVAQDRMAVRFEYVAQRNQDDELAAWQQQVEEGSGLGMDQLQPVPLVATLHLFNISRRRRGHIGDVQVVVDRVVAGQEGNSTGSSQQLVVRPGDRGLALQPGDTITLGTAPDAPRFRVEAAAQPAQPSTTAVIEAAVQRYCQPPVWQVIRGAAAPRNRQSPAMAAAAAAVESGQVLSLQQLAQLARANPGAADAGYRTAIAGPEMGNAFAWIAWAQLSARRGKLQKARNLFRVAVAVAAAASPRPDVWEGFRQADSGSLLDNTSLQADGVSSWGNASGDDQQQLHGDSSRRAGMHVWVIPSSSSSVALVQSLFTWGRFEWNLGRLKGAARHLWRAAADVAMLHENGPESGGLAVVLHNWVMSELEVNNVQNARVVVAEALRKCPLDQALFVAAAQVEHKGGNPELAREFCLRAYQLDRTDKHLYYVWPLVMASLGEREKARVLFERALDYHPRNTKIMDAYARFEAGVGDTDKALELHERALEVDPASWATMTNRTSWAQLEADQGDLRTAYKLLQEGLQLHPYHFGARLALARVHRLAGNWRAAQWEVRAASQLTHAFDVELLRERAALMRGLGEPALAASLEAHLAAVNTWHKAKKQGLNTGDAWQLYEQLSSSKDRQKLAQQAAARKVELGWLSAPGVPGPRAAKRSGRQTGWVPLPDPPLPEYTFPPRDDTLMSSQETAAGDSHQGAHTEGAQHTPVQLGMAEDGEGGVIDLGSRRSSSTSGMPNGRGHTRLSGNLESSSDGGVERGPRVGGPIGGSPVVLSGQQVDDGGEDEQEMRTPLLASSSRADPRALGR